MHLAHGDALDELGRVVKLMLVVSFVPLLARLVNEICGHCQTASETHQDAGDNGDRDNERPILEQLLEVEVSIIRLYYYPGPLLPELALRLDLFFLYRHFPSDFSFFLLFSHLFFFDPSGLFFELLDAGFLSLVASLLQLGLEAGLLLLLLANLFFKLLTALSFFFEALGLLLQLLKLGFRFRI